MAAQTTFHTATMTITININNTNVSDFQMQNMDISFMVNNFIGKWNIIEVT